LSGSYKDISVRFDGVIYALNQAGLVTISKSINDEFKLTTDGFKLSQISVGSDGNIWGINASNRKLYLRYGYGAEVSQINDRWI
jgi:hypothetical protein